MERDSSHHHHHHHHHHHDRHDISASNAAVASGGSASAQREGSGTGAVANSNSSTAATSGGKSNEFIVGGKYRLVRKIGSGSFGDIYLGVNIANGEEVAVKLEPVTARHPQLFYESRLYKVLMVSPFFCGSCMCVLPLAEYSLSQHTAFAYYK